MRRAALSVRICLGLGALCLAVFLVVGCGGGGGGSSTPIAAPVISQVRTVLSSGTSSLGGYVTIQAVVTDDTGVASVTATVTGPNGSTKTTTVPLVATELNLFYGVFSAPAISTGGPETYTVAVNAKDDSGNSAQVKTATFVVPDCPPPPD
jgi:hypothetical protein